MNDTFLKKNITISSSQDTGTQIKIKDETGKTYSFFKAKKEGGSTQAFEQFGHYKVGERTGISYKEVPFTTKDGKNLTLNNIMGFMPVLPEASNAPVSAKSAPQTENKYETDKGEEFWEKKAYKQCLWGYFLQLDDKNIGLDQSVMDLVWKTFNQIDQDANKRFAKGWDKAVAIYGGDEPKTLNTNPKIDLSNTTNVIESSEISDIPF